MGELPGAIPKARNKIVVGIGNVIARGGASSAIRDVGFLFMAQVVDFPRRFTSRFLHIETAESVAGSFQNYRRSASSGTHLKQDLTVQEPVTRDEIGQPQPTRDDQELAQQDILRTGALGAPAHISQVARTTCPVALATIFRNLSIQR